MQLASDGYGETKTTPLAPSVDAAVPEGGLESASSMPPVESVTDYRMNRLELSWNDMVGTGCTADVFKGSWRGEPVAIKRLKFNKGNAETMKQEVTILVRETTILERISHRNLVEFYGMVFDQHPYLLITEFCNGGTCFHLVHVNEDLQMETKQQLKICQDVAHAMDYLHEFRPQIIHRDLKSLNLLLVEPVTTTRTIPHVKVCDFGLSRMKDNPDDWGMMTKEVGSANWMAPEMATGNYNEKVDIYSFAMVLFEMIGQEIPFDDLEPCEVLVQAVRGARPDLEAIPPWIPADLVALMKQCWGPQPSKRPSFSYIATTLDGLVEQMFG